MRLQGRIATLYTSENGRNVLRLAGIGGEAEIGILEAEIVDTEDLGIWIVIEPDRVERHFLLLWEYIIAVETAAEEERPAGLSSGKGLG